MLTSLFPQARVIDWKVGDLTGDGIDDMAMMIVEDVKPDSDERILVLKGNSDGTYGLLVKSLAYPSVSYTTTTMTLRIKGNALFVGSGGPSDSESVSSVEYQFKQRGADLCLIGYKAQKSNNTMPDDQGLSINLLTGDRVEWRKINTKRFEIRSKLETMPLLKLAAFGLDVNIPYDTSALGYSIDKDLRVRAK